MNDVKYQKCPICGSPQIPSQLTDGILVDCSRCGKYKISETAIATKPKCNDIQIANLSGWLRERQLHEIDSKQWEQLLTIKTPTVGEKAIKLLRYIAIKTPIPGKGYNLSNYSLRNILKTFYSEDSSKNPFFIRGAIEFLNALGITWSVDETELRYLVDDYLKTQQQYLSGGFTLESKITPKGWEFLESLKYKNVDSQIAFIAMWFDKSMDKLYNSIKKSILKSGYDPKRVDKHEHVNKIDDEIIALIRHSKFIVADYTEQNHGVYFESGLAMGLDLRVIWTCKKDEIDNLHFDTSHYNFLPWEEDKLPEFEEKLKNRILAVIGKGTYNPD